LETVSQLAARAAALLGAGKIADALAAYDAILRIEPRNAYALHYSGLAFYQSGDVGQAIARLRASLAVDGRQSDAWSNLGLVLQAAGQAGPALDACERAAALDPASPEILVNLAATQSACGQHARAEATARRLIALDATRAKAWFVLAVALREQGRALEALDAVSKAAGLDPAQQAFAAQKAQLEAAIGAPERARKTLESALARLPASVPLRFELASLLERDLGDLPRAAAEYAQVQKLDPRHGATLSQLAFLRGRLADWQGRYELVARYRAGVAAATPALSPFAFLSLPSTRAEQRACARTWAGMFPAARPASAPRLRGAGRLRVGYLSADFHSHATAFLAAGLFEQHDRSRFKVVAYSTGPDDRSPMRARIVKAFDDFRDMRGASPLAIAQTIRNDGIDILVDLKGHTQDAIPAVLALRPAAIQVHYLGYPGTLEGGLVDYLVGDRIVTPEEHRADYAEAIAVLPDSYQVNDRDRPIGQAPSRAELDLPEGAVVLASFNKTYKINPDVFDAWTSILRAVPRAVLWLLRGAEDDPAMANLRREAHARGVSADRLVFARHRPNAEYLALYRHADLFLDTWPYNAHTTASDALWAGCPVLTILGTTFAGRVAASLLTAVGLPELVTASIPEYVDRAIALCNDAGERERLAAHLAGAGRASALFDTTRTTQALEEAYLTMAAQHRRGVRESFAVSR
jgi:predicted O-linked N-acetylglucosamine transferase (SPINDLY family)